MRHLSKMIGSAGRTGSGWLNAAPIGWLISVALVGMNSIRSSAALPNNFGPSLQRVASAKSWRIDSSNSTYQWASDGRLVVWVGSEDSSSAQLLDPKTGTHDPLILFNHLALYAVPPPQPGPGQYAPRDFNISPDGDFEVSFN